MDAYHVEALLPLALRPLSAADLAARGATVLEGPLVELPRAARRGDGVDGVEELKERIGALEKKVDVLIELLLRKERKDARHAAAPVALSMERVVFAWPERLAPGASFELELQLALLPPTELHLVVEIVSCEAVEDPPAGRSAFQVEARFAALGEDEADAIHRYLLTCQRRARRARGAA